MLDIVAVRQSEPPDDRPALAPELGFLCLHPRNVAAIVGVSLDLAEEPLDVRFADQ